MFTVHWYLSKEAGHPKKVLRNHHFKGNVDADDRRRQTTTDDDGRRRTITDELALEKLLCLSASEAKKNGNIKNVLMEYVKYD